MLRSKTIASALAATAGWFLAPSTTRRLLRWLFGPDGTNGLVSPDKLRFRSFK